MSPFVHSLRVRLWSDYTGIKDTKLLQDPVASATYNEIWRATGTAVVMIVDDNDDDDDVDDDDGLLLLMDVFLKREPIRAFTVTSFVLSPTTSAASATSNLRSVSQPQNPRKYTTQIF